MNLPQQLFRWAVVAVAVAILSGCSQPLLKKGMRWPWEKDEPGPPTKIVAMWTDAVLHQPNQPARRGFGGRLMFYDSKGKAPIQVEGQLIVYAFDETVVQPNKIKPDRKYVFTKEQFAEHYSKSSLGHSYSVWIPWDAAGGPQREISLIVRFISEKGDVIVGEQTKHILPGATPENKPQAGTASLQGVSAQGPGAGPQAGQVQLVSHEAPAPAQAEGTQDATQAEGAQSPGRKMATATIQMPSRFGRPGPIAAPGSQPGARADRPEGDSPIFAARKSGQSPATAPASWAPGQGPSEPAGSPPSTRSAPSKPRALGEPIARLPRERGPWQPCPVVPPYRPGASTPAPPIAPAGSASAPGAASGSN